MTRREDLREASYREATFLVEPDETRRLFESCSPRCPTGIRNLTLRIPGLAALAARVERAVETVDRVLDVAWAVREIVVLVRQGLGPGSGDLLTPATWRAIRRAQTLWPGVSINPNLTAAEVNAYSPMSESEARLMDDALRAWGDVIFRGGRRAAASLEPPVVEVPDHAAPLAPRSDAVPLMRERR